MAVLAGPIGLPATREPFFKTFQIHLKITAYRAITAPRRKKAEPADLGGLDGSQMHLLDEIRRFRLQTDTNLAPIPFDRLQRMGHAAIRTPA